MGDPKLYLPADAGRGMAQALGVETRNDKSAVLLGDVPCSLASTCIVVGFNNEATKINVPLDLLMAPGASAGQCSIPSIIGLENGVTGGLRGRVVYFASISGDFEALSRQVSSKTTNNAFV